MCDTPALILSNAKKKKKEERSKKLLTDMSVILELGDRRSNRNVRPAWATYQVQAQPDLITKACLPNPQNNK